jgi:hypothetical protein
MVMSSPLKARHVVTRGVRVGEVPPDFLAALAVKFVFVVVKSLPLVCSVVELVTAGATLYPAAE